MSSLLLTCRNKSSVEQHYVPALRMGGWSGTIHLLAPGDAAPPWADVAGLVLAGGDDIHPANWDPAEPVHPEAEPDPDRDALEIPLTRAAWGRNLPILGICRGEQLLNVALGGTLIQDVPSHFGCAEDLHRLGSSNEAPVLPHRVAVAPGSRLHGILASLELEVNSRHHQAVGRLAPDLTACAWHPGTSRDGAPLIEAVEALDPARWVLGVQWHPENLIGLPGAAGDAARALFRGFATALGAR